MESPDLKKAAKLPTAAVTTKIAHASSSTSMILPADVTELVAMRRDGQQLDAGEEGGVAETMYLATISSRSRTARSAKYRR